MSRSADRCARPAAVTPQNGKLRLRPGRCSARSWGNAPVSARQSASLLPPASLLQHQRAQRTRPGQLQAHHAAAGQQGRAASRLSAAWSEAPKAQVRAADAGQQRCVLHPCEAAERQLVQPARCVLHPLQPQQLALVQVQGYVGAAVDMETAEVGEGCAGMQQRLG
jgi:hypothetical protein